MAEAELAAFENSGLTPEEAKEAADLLRAKKEGRLVELPCKVGDTIYKIEFTPKCAGCPDNEVLPVDKCRLYTGQCERVEKWNIRPIPFIIEYYNWYKKSFKRDFYLTVEEAETALKERPVGIN